MYTNGPLGRYVDDLARMMKVLLNEDHYSEAPAASKDVYWKPRAFNDRAYTQEKKLKIGYFKSFRYAPSSAAS